MLTLIGDAHGHYKQHLDIIKNAEYSLQIGDCGFRYDYLKDVDPERHKLFGGNHDDYNLISNCPHNLGDFGQVELGGISFFYMRGGFSIDRKYRTIGIDWWAEEELSREKMEEAIELYEQVRPEIVIAHECPRQIANLVGNPNVLREFGFDPNTFTTRTSETLQIMFEKHAPHEFIFGHFHKSWTKVITGLSFGMPSDTNFRCLNELETYILDE